MTSRKSIAVRMIAPVAAAAAVLSPSLLHVIPTVTAFSITPPLRCARLPRVAQVATATSTAVQDAAASGGQDNPDAIWLPDEVDSIFGCLDANGDGVVTPDELRAHMVDTMGYSTEYTDYLFESIDTDSNGSISREELGFAFYNFEALGLYATLGLGGADLTRRPAFQKLLSEQRDSNDQQRWLLNDLADLVFDLIDTDGSGGITKDELSDHFRRVTDKLAASSAETATVGQTGEYVSTMFDTLDANKDGTLCREEVRDAFGTYDFRLLARTFGLRVYQSP
mmetsp:Transcript_24936/g.58513  ORF Transcript_24936/g.58513 Transcript_24936/m.58513 type:complete len:281 (-) Transcript_24936:165-1007(-)|eukprot:CAMPEP_0197183288 /NCGR_PEP_ID=MMETSP1423-20130617/7737_1 /TAXON_ID=476441 /ORGANISM="Pseudo-nitzschia heimii, Strain UNC1101" /LENGTH=280 /DNA_ID=CAMNT_0042633853 /DNA_START=156 /DNA_END=998 /DNA_ORIENTATION=-